MITRNDAEQGMMLLIHARKRFDEWLEVTQSAGRDPLYGEPKAAPAVDRVSEELVGLSGQVCSLLDGAGLPIAFDLLGRSHELFSRHDLYLHTSLAPRVVAALDAGVAFYKEIALAPQRSPSESMNMKDKQKRLDEKDAQRLRVLDAIYELTDGDTRAYTSYAEVFERAGVTEDEGTAATNFLGQAGLLQGTAGYVSLTHQGADERERALRDHGSRTDHFSAAAVQQVFNIHGPVNVLQTGHGNTATNVTQRADSGGDATLRALLKDLRAEAQSTPEPDRDEAVSAAQKIELHATRTPLDPDRLKKYIELYATVSTVVSPTLRALVEHFGPQIPALVELLKHAV